MVIATILQIHAAAGCTSTDGSLDEHGLPGTCSDEFASGYYSFHYSNNYFDKQEGVRRIAELECAERISNGCVERNDGLRRYSESEC